MGTRRPRRWAIGGGVVAVVAVAAFTVVAGLGAVPGVGRPTPAGAAANPSVWSACAGGLTASTPGTLADPDLREVSGIVSGRRSAGVWWAHNDSGDSARVFAVGDDGRALGTFTLGGAAARDWEDIAVGPGPDAGVAYLYLADIGDNSAVRPSVQVYRVVEPAVATTGTPVRQTLTGVAVLDLVYPGGPRDAEALLVDPVSGALLIVTKSWTGTADVYRAPAGLTAGSSTVLTRVASLAPGIVTGADVTPAGDVVALRTYTGVRLYRRAAGTPVEAAFAGVSCAAQSAPETQGEAIGFTTDGTGYVTVSEGTAQPLHRFGVPAPPSTTTRPSVTTTTTRPRTTTTTRPGVTTTSRPRTTPTTQPRVTPSMVRRGTP